MLLEFGDEPEGPAPPDPTPKGPTSWPDLLDQPVKEAKKKVISAGFDAQEVLEVS